MADPTAGDTPEGGPGRHSSGNRNLMLGIVTVLLVIAGLRASYPVTMPLAAAVVVVAALWPIKSRMDRVLPSFVGTTAMALLLFCMLVGFFAAIYFSAAQVVGAFADQQDELNALFESVSHLAEKWGLPALDGGNTSGRLAGIAQQVLSSTYTMLGYFGFIGVLVIFGLPEVKAVRRKLRTSLEYDNRQALIDIAGRSADKVRSYLGAATLASIVTGVASGLWALAVGLDLALVWGVLNFLLNYVPVIGNVVGILPPTLYAMIQYDGWTMPAVVFAGYAVLQFIISNFVYPALQGRSLSLSPVAIILALAFWSWVWGIAGALIAVPLTASLVIVLQHFPRTAWIADLLAQEHGDDSGD